MTLAAAGCGGGGSGGKPTGAPTMKVVGTSGGAVTSSDGNLAVNIPPGALPSNVTITTEPAEAPAMGAVGTVYEIGPTGTQFAMPVTLTLHYDMAMLNGANESSLRVATYAGGAWQLLPGAMIDTQARTVSGVTTHLSPYAIVTEAVGKTCATVQPSWGCAADAGVPASAGSAGGGAGASTGTNAPSDPGGTSTCNAPTCANATNVCDQYPGAAMDSCTDSPKGYSAACCFPSNAPICFALNTAGAPCAAPAGGGTSCPPPPTCGSASAAMACAGYPGSTLQNCTNTTNGFTGACCFAPEARVCVKAGAGRACAADAGVGPGGTGTGAGGTSCPPPPRCADANPCAGFVGATADSCTDTADGFEATCCFAAGTLPISSRSSGAGGSSDGGVPAADAGMGGPDGGTGTGATGGGQDGGAGGQDGGTPPPCVAGVACTPGYKCDPGSSTSCTVCMCGADGHLTCGPCGSGTGATGGGAGGAGGSTGPTRCAPGEPCTAGSKCGAADVGGACMDCMCGVDGTLICAPCGGGTGATSGTAGAGGSTGTMTCAPGAPCTAGSNCGAADVGGACMNCMCGANGTWMCAPCGGTGATGGTTGAGGTAGTQTCAPGAPCTQGFKCDPGSASCMICMCGADGVLACGPCGGTGATGGTTGAGGSTGGPASGPCQVNWMPAADVGQPCSVMEVCPDGTDYRVRCDGNGACTCFVKGAPTSTMPALSCSGLVPSVALMACGFPDGKI